MRLTASQISSFCENGYLLLENVLDADDLRPVIEEYSAIIDERAQRLYNEGKVSSLYADEPFVRRVACLAADILEIGNGLDIMEVGEIIAVASDPLLLNDVRGKATFNLMKNPKILDLAESLGGSEIVGNPIQHIRVVPPLRSGRPIPWHQDAGTAWPEADPYFMLTIWGAITDATLENGCLEVTPGSHKSGLYRHIVTPDGLDIPPEALPPLDPQPLPVPAGGVILFHNYSFHRARPNQTDEVRCSFDLRDLDVYQPTGRPYYPAFLVRSKLRPDAVQTDYEAWRQRWEFAIAHSTGAARYRW